MVNSRLRDRYLSKIRSSGSKTPSAFLSCLTVVVLGWWIAGCSTISSTDHHSFVLTSSDLLYEIGGSWLNEVRPDNDILTVASAPSFGFLKANPTRVRVDGKTLRVTGTEPMSSKPGMIQIIDGKLYAPGHRLSADSRRTMQQP